MSHNYPYRRPLPDTDLRHSSSDCHHTSPDHDFHKPPQESSPLRSFSSSSSRGSEAALHSFQGSQDGAFSILSSCGLEPSDLSLLAELPEDALTVESLPHLLQQIKGRRGTVKPSPPSSSSYLPGSARRPAGEWNHLHSRPVQYPLDHVTPGPLPQEQVHDWQDRWGNPRRCGSAPRTSSSPRDAPSSSSSYMVDHEPASYDYGKTGRDFPSARGEILFSQCGPADYRSVPPLEENPLRGRAGCRQAETSSSRSSGQLTADAMPFRKEALDFHGTSPTVYPYSCSLCDITVLSERNWHKHINGTHHADGQLNLLQRFPMWDCRMETASRTVNQSEKHKDEGPTPQLPQTSNQSSKLQPTRTGQKKTDKGKVVCVKFPAQSVDDTYLRKLTEPFGKIMKVLLFPSLAFVELGSVDQANELVKFHRNNPPIVNGEQMEFNISNTFNFLQRSQVLSFIPAPTGEDGRTDLITIVKRFGSPLYTLFLQSKAFVEMRTSAEAEKLVDYYTSTTLRINNDSIQVGFSEDYKSLMRVSSAERYEEDTWSTKRTGSQSRETEDKTIGSTRTRSSSNEGTSRSRSRDKSSREGTSRSSREGTSRSRDKSSREGTSRSRDKSSREGTSRSRSRDKSSREGTSRSRDKSSREGTSRSRDKSSREGTSRSQSRDKSSREGTSRSRSRDKSSREGTSRSRDKSSREGTSRSRSRDKSSREGTSRSRDKVTVPEQPVMNETESRTDCPPAPLGDSRPESLEEEVRKLEDSLGEDSDIEGMEVIGEDGENLEDDDVETLEGAEDHEEEEEEQGEEKQVQDGEADEQQEEELESHEEEEETAELEDDEEEQDFPVDLENCITLDELGDDQSDDAAEDPEGPERSSHRVIYFCNLSRRHFNGNQFIDLVKGFGTAVRFLLFHIRREGFIEMSRSSEAVRVVKELNRKHVTPKDSKPFAQISTYSRLTAGWKVPSGSEDDRSRSSRRRDRCSKSKTNDTSRMSSERDKSKKERKKESSKKTQEEESESMKTEEKESGSTKAEEKESAGEESEEKEAKRTTEETPSKVTVDQDPSSRESAVALPAETIQEKTLKRNASGEGDSLPAKMSKENLRNENPESDKLSAEDEPEELQCNQTSSQPAGRIQDPDPRGPEEAQRQQLLSNPVAAADEDDGPAGGAEEPISPVGTEFIRPVVGYFCHLCQLIYANEDEAKLQHCRSRRHYAKYLETTGKES